MRYWFYRFLAFLVRIMPLKFAYWFWLRLCDASFFLNRKGREAVKDNIRTVFEDQGIRPAHRVIDGLTRKTFQSFGKYLADFIRFRKLTINGFREYVSIQGMEHLEAIRDSKRGAIMLTAHYGNWELGGAFIAAMGIPINVIVRPVPNPALERLFHFFREQRGMKVIPLEHAGMATIKALKRGEAVALVGDRDFSGNGVTRDFLGRETTLPRGAAWFAHRLSVPLYIGFATRTPDDSFILRLHDPIDPKDYPTEEAIQDQIIAIMEETIARDPTQWFIFDRFWPEKSKESSDTPACPSQEEYPP